MRDRNLATFVIVIFATGGIAVLALGGLRPMPAEDRVIANLVGALGILMAVTFTVFRILNRRGGGK